jgi:biotin synthase-like enzyme
VNQTEKADDESAFFAMNKAHDKACLEAKDFYIDTKTGYHVMTSYFLKNRGYCCKNDCRHCPYKILKDTNDE